jgi:hypothetical protein
MLEKKNCTILIIQLLLYHSIKLSNVNYKGQKTSNKISWYHIYNYQRFVCFTYLPSFLVLKMKSNLSYNKICIIDKLLITLFL